MVILKKNNELAQGFIISTVLNVFFMIGLIFIIRLDNLFILIPYVLIMGLNAGYLVAKAIKINKNKSEI